MKFFDYTTIYEVVKKQHPHIVDRERWLEANTVPLQKKGFLTQAMAENAWVRCRRPYFNVWPGITEALMRVKLDLPTESLDFPLPQLLLRFPEGDPLPCGTEFAKTIFFSMAVSGIEGRGKHRDPTKAEVVPLLCYWMDFGHTKEYATAVSWAAIELKAGNTVEREMELIESSRGSEMTQKDRTMHIDAIRDAMRMIVAVTLLGIDSEMVVPDILSKDKGKVPEGQPIPQKLIEKAHRRGKIAYDIGKELDDSHREGSPHYRRPHFGLRWTGKGGSIPKIVPIKGTVVGRKKMTEVPTGYLDDEMGDKMSDKEEMKQA